jgi:EKC/KEOPS complex subunit PCC1/LAGE3
MTESGNAFSFKWEAKIHFENAAHAVLVNQALSVDPELRPDDVKRLLQVRDSTLIITFEAKQMRMLRAATGTFLDLLALAVRTLDAFKDSMQP